MRRRKDIGPRKSVLRIGNVQSRNCHPLIHAMRGVRGVLPRQGFAFLRLVLWSATRFISPVGDDFSSG